MHETLGSISSIEKKEEEEEKEQEEEEEKYTKQQSWTSREVWADCLHNLHKEPTQTTTSISWVQPLELEAT